ncbi:hemerythrin domain-containing protein [Methylobacterium sp. ID0610]|uniref:hemerythrin domain-containing protein n=1 Tax=Methylobacterium carpenticola TaxID=3344827 RepID=UPI0036B9BB9B
MDIWQLTARDHANITALVREIPYALNGPGVVRSRERLLADLMGELHAHSEAIEASLLERLRAHGRGRPLLDELHREHHQMMQQLDQLARRHGKDSQGWLNTFEDVSYLVDRHLYRHTHELFPLARNLLSAGEVQTATQAFMRTKIRALRSGSRGLPRQGASSGLFGALAVGLAASAVAAIVWRSGLLRGRAGGRLSPERTDRPGGIGRGKPRADLAAASAPGNRVAGEDLRHRQDRLLDEALEETFPSSDPISPHQITR